MLLQFGWISSMQCLLFPLLNNISAVLFLLQRLLYSLFLFLRVVRSLVSCLPQLLPDAFGWKYFLIFDICLLRSHCRFIIPLPALLLGIIDVSIADFGCNFWLLSINILTLFCRSSMLFLLLFLDHVNHWEYERMRKSER